MGLHKTNIFDEIRLPVLLSEAITLYPIITFYPNIEVFSLHHKIDRRLTLKTQSHISLFIHVPYIPEYGACIGEGTQVAVLCRKPVSRAELLPNAQPSDWCCVAAHWLSLEHLLNRTQQNSKQRSQYTANMRILPMLVVALVFLVCMVSASGEFITKLQIELGMCFVQRWNEKLM